MKSGSIKDQVSEKLEKTGGIFLKLEKGQNRIRIIDEKMVHVYYHRVEGADGQFTKVFCAGGEDKAERKNASEKCKYCAMAEKDDDMRAASRYFLKVISVMVEKIQKKDGVKLRVEADPKVRLLETGIKIYRQIESMAIDPDYGSITEYDLVIEKSGAGTKTDTDYEVVRKPSEKSCIFPDEGDLEDEVGDLKKFLKGFIKSNDASEDEDEDKPKKKKKSEDDDDEDEDKPKKKKKSEDDDDEDEDKKKKEELTLKDVKAMSVKEITKLGEKIGIKVDKYEDDEEELRYQVIKKFKKSLE